MFHVLQVSTGYSNGSLEAEKILAAGGAHTLLTKETPEAIIRAGQDSEGLLVTLTQVTASMIRQMPKLKVIVRAGIGVDSIDLEAARKRNIQVYNLPHYCQDEVADHTVAMLLALERKLIRQVQDVKQGQWNPARLYKPICGMHGSVIGFLGCGGIARRVAARLQPFGASFIGCDPYLPPETAKKAGIVLTDLEGVLSNADFLSLHLPLTDQTHHIVNRSAIQKMKTGAYLVNSARGQLVDNNALYEAIESGHLAGAALDVIEEDLKGASRFNELPNVLITPHSAYYSEQSSVKIRSQAGEIFAAIIRGEQPDSRIV